MDYGGLKPNRPLNDPRGALLMELIFPERWAEHITSEVFEILLARGGGDRTSDTDYG